MAFDFGVLSGTAVSAAERLVNGVGKGIGSLMDRAGFTEKLSEGAKLDKMIEGLELSIKDSDTARQMFMVEMKTQKHSWFVRFINGMFRPICGYLAMAYLTESIWSQILTRFGWDWKPITHDPVVDICMVSIIGFFFGLRQRSKEKAVTDIS